MGTRQLQSSVLSGLFSPSTLTILNVLRASPKNPTVTLIFKLTAQLGCQTIWTHGCVSTHLVLCCKLLRGGVSEPISKQGDTNNQASCRD